MTTIYIKVLTTRKNFDYSALLPKYLYKKITMSVILGKLYASTTFYNIIN